MGPRQVGKTTLVSQLVEKIGINSHFVAADAVPAAGSNWISFQWETARIKMDHENSESFLLVLDEIQKIENWSETVKMLWDEDTRNKKNLKVILLGSSRLLLQKGLTESLAGRFEITMMSHWSYKEMNQAFGLSADQFVWYGGYPGAASLIEDETRWKSYVLNSLIETSISKDILMLTRVDKPALMKRLFELGCLYSGQILSYSKLLGQLQDAGNTTTLSHYLSLLDTAGLLCGIEKFTPDTLRQRASSPKFQVYNSALISAQQGMTFGDIRSNPTEWGRIIESAIGAHLKNHSISEKFNLFYWRDRNDEVDFVIEKNGSVIGIEVKSGPTPFTSGMSAFQKRFQPDKMILAGSAGLPWEVFLTINPASLF
jgi:hypothetical protein